MNIQTYILLIAISILLIGLIVIIYNRNKIVEIVNFLHCYRNTFISMSDAYFCRGYEAARSVDQDLYYWLTQESKKAKEKIRVSGGYFNLNSISKFQSGSIKTNEAQSVEDTFLRSIGYYNQKIEKYLMM